MVINVYGLLLKMKRSCFYCLCSFDDNRPQLNDYKQYIFKSMSRSFLKLYLMVSTTIPIQYINNEYIVEAFPNVAETPTTTCELDAQKCLRNWNGKNMLVRIGRIPF